MSNDKIPGVPEGWELVRIGKPEIGEWFIDGLSEPYQAIDDGHFRGCAIIRKIEKPARYRQFANAAEFKPHRDRWWYRDDKDGRRHFPRQDTATKLTAGLLGSIDLTLVFSTTEPPLE